MNFFVHYSQPWTHTALENFSSRVMQGSTGPGICSVVPTPVATPRAPSLTPPSPPFTMSPPISSAGVVSSSFSLIGTCLAILLMAHSCHWVRFTRKASRHLLTKRHVVLKQEFASKLYKRESDIQDCSPVTVNFFTICSRRILQQIYLT